MSKTMVQIRNAPSEFHRRLKAKAAIEGMSISDYVLRDVGKALDRPTRKEVLERLRARPPPPPPPQCRPGDTCRAGRRMIILDASVLVELLLGTPT